MTDPVSTLSAVTTVTVLLSFVGVLAGAILGYLTAPALVIPIVRRAVNAPVERALGGGEVPFPATLLTYIGISSGYGILPIVVYGWLAAQGAEALFAIWGALLLACAAALFLGLIRVAPARGVDWNDGDYGLRASATLGAVLAVYHFLFAVVGIAVLLIALYPVTFL